MPNLFGGGGGAPRPQPAPGPRQTPRPVPVQPRPNPVASQRGREPGPGEKGLDFFGRLFLNQLNPDERKAFTKKELDRLRSRAMLTTGLSMLSAAGRPGATFGQALAAGVLMGQRHAAQTAGELLDTRQAQERAIAYRSVFEGTDMTELERWQQARKIAAARGETETVKTFNTVIEELRERQEGESEREFKVVNGTPVWVDAERQQVFDLDGNLVRDLKKEAEEADPMEGSFTKKVVGQDGQLHTVLFNRAGQPIRDLGLAEAGGAGSGQADPEQAQVASELRREVGNIRSILGDDPETEEVEGSDRFGATGTFGRLARFLPAELEPSSLKQLRAASENILSLIVRQRSGAQATDAEVERLKSFAIPKPGDDPETVRTKLERLENMVRDFERLGANAVTDPIMLGRAGGDVDTIISETFGGP